MKFAAVRTVSEDDEFRLVEGLAFPFKGRDTYMTFFSARTDFHWDLYPDCAPLTAGTRATAEPRFIRPDTYHHGFDPEIGLARIGGWSPVRMDADGVWVQAQIAKRAAYYEGRIKPLLDAGALGLSGGSAEHSVRIDQRSGEILDWPAYELAFTPVESNPLAVVAARSDNVADALRIVTATSAVRSADYSDALRIIAAVGGAVRMEDARGALRIVAARGWLPEGTTQGDLDDGDFAWVASDKSLPDSERRKLPYKVHGKVNEDGWKAAWSRANQDGTDFEGGPDKAAVIKKLIGDKPADVKIGDAAKSGVRAWSEAASDAAMGAGALGTLLYLLGPEADEPDQVEMIQRSIDALTEWITAERAEVGTPDDIADSVGYLSGVRVGARNSASDASQMQTAHDAIASVLGLGCAPDSEDSSTDEGDDAARSGERLPTFKVVERPDPPALRADLLDRARQIGEEAAKRLTG